MNGDVFDSRPLRWSESYPLMQREGEDRVRTVLAAVRSSLSFDSEYVSACDAIERGDQAMHLAIMHEPFLTYLVEGRKTIESRFTIKRIAPFDYASEGDLVLFKGLGADVNAVGLIDEVLQFKLNSKTWPVIKVNHADAICADEAFFEARKDAAFATLMRMRRIDIIDAVRVEKRDRRGWVVLLPRRRQERLF